MGKKREKYTKKSSSHKWSRNSAQEGASSPPMREGVREGIAHPKETVSMDNYHMFLPEDFHGWDGLWLDRLR